MGCLLETVAGVGVGNRQREEAEADGKQNEIEHMTLLQKQDGATARGRAGVHTLRR